MATRVRPFRGRTTAEVASAILQDAATKSAAAMTRPSRGMWSPSPVTSRGEPQAPSNSRTSPHFGIRRRNLLSGRQRRLDVASVAALAAILEPGTAARDVGVGHGDFVLRPPCDVLAIRNRLAGEPDSTFASRSSARSNALTSTPSRTPVSLAHRHDGAPETQPTPALPAVPPGHPERRRPARRPGPR